MYGSGRKPILRLDTVSSPLFHYSCNLLIIWVKAYADDLTLITKSVQGNQLAVDYTKKWLKWTETMKAKPKKCVCVGFKKFGKNVTSTLNPIKNTAFSPFDPKLQIAGERFRFIFDPSQPDDSLKKSHFKFLGRWSAMALKDSEVADFVKKEFLSFMDLVDESAVNGLMKLWIYQHFLLSKISWPFMIYNFSLSFVKKLQSKITIRLKKWAGIFAKADSSILYRPRHLLGLELTSLTVYFKKLQVTKCLLLQNSVDENIKAWYDFKASKEASMTRYWRATKFSTTVSSMAMHNIKFPSQTTNLGIGWGKYNPNPSSVEFRKMAMKEIMTLENEAILSHAVSLSLQGNWTNWIGRTPSTRMST